MVFFRTFLFSECDSQFSFSPSVDYQAFLWQFILMRYTLVNSHYVSQNEKLNFSLIPNWKLNLVYQIGK